MHTPLALTQGTPDDLPELVDIDADASALYRRAGLSFVLPDDHPFLRDEAARWARAAREGGVWIARQDGLAVGFAVLGHIDGARHFDQLAVRTSAQGRGVGGTLVRHVQGRVAEEGLPIWVTTYAHFPWNAPAYVRMGFRVVDEAACGPGLRATLARERAALPMPDRRVARRWDPPGCAPPNADGERGSRGLS